MNKKDQADSVKAAEVKSDLKTLRELKATGQAGSGKLSINIPGEWPGIGVPYPGEQVVEAGVSVSADGTFARFGGGADNIPPGGNWLAVVLEFPADVQAGRSYPIEKTGRVKGSVHWEWDGRPLRDDVIVSGTITIERIELPLIFKFRLDDVHLSHIATPPCIDGSFETY